MPVWPIMLDFRHYEFSNEIKTRISVNHCIQSSYPGMTQARWRHTSERQVAGIGILQSYVQSKS
jgi:hypothetical protein